MGRFLPWFRPSLLTRTLVAIVVYTETDVLQAALTALDAICHVNKEMETAKLRANGCLATLAKLSAHHEQAVAVMAGQIITNHFAA